tara:strand:+ start:8628 stop:9668 length:1041 start_codon:yes stop_codon:yes gene_type:complete
MLPLRILLKQLDTMQSLKLESTLQSMVSFDSAVMLVFNCAMLGQTPEEIKRVCMLREDAYPTYERPIYNAILNLYGLKASKPAEKLLSDVFYALNEEKFESSKERAQRLEFLFHMMKKNKIEQESAALLKELYHLYKDTPLESVYEHLFNKYDKIAKVNLDAYNCFRGFNKKLKNFINYSVTDKSELTRLMIKDYKKLRALYADFENNTLKVILLLTKLTLVKVCGQEQLLFENKNNLIDLFAETEASISELPFGVEKFFFQNIFRQIILADSESNGSLFYSKFENADYNNFNFPKQIRVAVKKVVETKRETSKVLRNISDVNNFGMNLVQPFTDSQGGPISFSTT